MTENKTPNPMDTIIKSSGKPWAEHLVQPRITAYLPASNPAVNPTSSLALLCSTLKRCPCQVDENQQALACFSLIFVFTGQSYKKAGFGRTFRRPSPICQRIVEWYHDTGSALRDINLTKDTFAMRPLRRSACVWSLVTNIITNIWVEAATPHRKRCLTAIFPRHQLLM